MKNLYYVTFFSFLKYSAPEFTTDFAFLLDGNIIESEVKTAPVQDILPELDHQTQRWKSPEDSLEDFFKVRNESDVTKPRKQTIFKVDQIIQDLAKKESAYQLAEIIREIKRKMTSVITTTTTVRTTQKTKPTPTTAKTTKGPKTKWKWKKKRKLPPPKPRTTKRTTKKIVTTKKEPQTSANPSRRSCGRLSPQQVEMFDDHDVSDVMFFKPTKKQQPKPPPKKQPTRRKSQGNNGKKGTPNKQKAKTTNKVTTTTEKEIKTTTKGELNSDYQGPKPDWLNSFRKAEMQGNVIDPSKPVFENDTHVLTRKRPVVKLDDIQTTTIPYIVTLHSDPPRTDRVCVGSLIASTWVLTAARCTIPPSLATRIRFGDMTLPPTDFQFTRILSTFPHPSLDETLFSNDICLLRIKKVAIEEKVGRLTSLEYLTMMGQPVKYTGFGFATPIHNMFAEDQRKPLQIVEGDVVPCLQIKNITGPAFCVAMKHWKRSQMTLKGDAGSPAIHFGRIAGVCTGEAHPPVAVYTPLSPYLDWIRYTVLLNEL